MLQPKHESGASDPTAARRFSYRMSFSYSNVRTTQSKGTACLTDELIEKKLKGDLLSFLRMANNVSLNDMIHSPQNRLVVVLDFFRKLQESAHSATVKLPIPDTLFQREDQSLHIYSEASNDAVRFREGSSALSSFLQRLEERSASRPATIVSESYPYSILLDEIGGHKVCLSLAEIRKRWQDARSQYKVMQEFVVPKVKEIVKYRVIWIKDRQPLVFIITRSGAPAAVIKSPEDRRYLHDINVFSYAGRLFRSSFTPFSPYTSNLQESLLEKHSSIPSRSSSKKQMIITTRPKDRFSLVKSAKRLPQLESMASTICDILRSRVVHSQDDIKLLIFDISQGHDGAFRLLNVKGLLCASKDLSLTQATIKSMSSLVERKMAKLSVKHSASKSRELLRSIDRQSHTAHGEKKCPFVDMKEANERKVSVYSFLSNLDLSDSTAPEKPKSRLRLYCTKLLSETAELYDSMRTGSSEKLLASSSNFFTVQPGYIETFLEKLFHRFQESSLSYYFKGKELQLTRQGIGKTLCGREGYTFRFRLKQIHAGLAISEKDFEMFITIVAQLMKEEGASDIDISSARGRLSRYKSEIVERASPELLRPSKKH